ncbi:hypothetical protein HMP09_1491 [Sphingomonas sp. HMP9]|uniref:DUF885 family protein n=1 Tax=Sphingomonas sp. HMP9 TaxID=1517554 RepID=UPI0015966942|nr:DUF885 family protein [Sphingomonas sp. HMP9]BCA62257.1 hypothetical protein HMP09_1491 [Sphingomonas sp. HMP9]
MTQTRRTILIGLTTSAFVPATIRAQSTTPIRQALDAAAATDPDEALRLLAPFDAHSLQPSDGLHLTTARAGLAIDAAIARSSFGRTGRSPYRVTPTTGAWKAAHPDATRIDADTAAILADAAAGIVLPRLSLGRTLDALRAAPANPAIDRQIAALESLRDTAPSAPGVGRLPGGADWYALQLQRSLGAMTPAYAERRLFLELRRLHARAAHLFDQIGASKGTIAARYAKLWREARFLYPDTDAGRTEAITDMNRMLAAARANILAAFGQLPPWCLNASARALSQQDIAIGRSGYRELPTPTRPGAYVVDLKDIRRRPRWTLPSVVAHELLPGHMIQLGLESAAPPHPLRIEYASSFVEGWGIYAEQLAEKAGAYADPYDALGHTHWLLFRVARALVDLGIHLHGWSIEQARDCLAEWQGEPAYFAPFDIELARIPLEPGTRVAEAMAWLAMADNSRNRSSAAYHRSLLLLGRKRIPSSYA